MPRLDLNQRPSAYEADELPLLYSAGMTVSKASLFVNFLFLAESNAPNNYFIVHDYIIAVQILKGEL